MYWHNFSISCMFESRVVGCVGEYYWNYLIMEGFSLEEEDYGDLFITQSSRGSSISDGNIEFSGANGCELVGEAVRQGQYSDISDEEFEVPVSQNASFTQSDDKR